MLIRIEYLLVPFSYKKLHNLDNEYFYVVPINALTLNNVF